jgi:hypothetical protein
LSKQPPKARSSFSAAALNFAVAFVVLIGHDARVWPAYITMPLVANEVEYGYAIAISNNRLTVDRK